MDESVPFVVWFLFIIFPILAISTTLLLTFITKTKGGEDNAS